MKAFVLWDRTGARIGGIGAHRLSLVPGSAHIRGSLNEWFLSEWSCTCWGPESQAEAGRGFQDGWGNTWTENGVVWSRQPLTFW